MAAAVQRGCSYHAAIKILSVSEFLAPALNQFLALLAAVVGRVFFSLQFLLLAPELEYYREELHVCLVSERSVSWKKSFTSISRDFVYLFFNSIYQIILSFYHFQRLEMYFFKLL